VRDTLQALVIDTCGKIRDFSVLKELRNLKYLRLVGSNVLPDISFIKELPNLTMFEFLMNTEDGDISECMNLPFARIKNRKHYSHKDSELPKNYDLDVKLIIPPFDIYGR
jgi:hypothetical protein